MPKNLQSFFVLHGLAKGIVTNLKPKWISELPGCKRKKGERERAIKKALLCIYPYPFCGFT